MEYKSEKMYDNKWNIEDNYCSHPCVKDMPHDSSEDVWEKMNFREREKCKISICKIM